MESKQNVFLLTIDSLHCNKHPVQRKQCFTLAGEKQVIHQFYGKMYPPVLTHSKRCKVSSLTHKIKGPDALKGDLKKCYS